MGAFDTHEGIQETREERKESQGYIGRSLEAISDPAKVARAPAKNPYKTLAAVGSGMLYSGVELADGEGPIAGRIADYGEGAYETVVNGGAQGANMIASHPDETQQALDAFGSLF